MQKLLTDITEIACVDGKLYISPIMDCFNGEIVALEMRENMKKELHDKMFKENSENKINEYQKSRKIKFRED